MKTIGLLGGMSWESTLPYYRILNETVGKELGKPASAEILLHSVNFAVLEALLQEERWEEIADILSSAAKGLENAGAELMAICTNTMHRVAPEICKAIGIPLVHIADATVNALVKARVGTVALLGTRFTMQQDFYKEKIWNRGIEILLPDDWQMSEVDRIIFEELCQGTLSERSKTFFLALIETLAHQGAQGVLLGCTELGLLLHEKDAALPLFDTTVIHARRIANIALQSP